MTGAFWYRFRAQLRGRWRGLLAIALLLGVAGGMAMAAAAGARRTASAFDRMLDANAPSDVLVNPNDGNDSALRPDDIEALPMVEEAAYIPAMTVFPVADADALDFVIPFGNPDGRWGRTIDRPNLVNGRMPDPDRADEVYLSKSVADALGVHAGDRMTLGVASGEELSSQSGSFEDAVAAIAAGDLGRLMDVTVTGVGVMPDEIVVDEGFESGAILVTPAFLEDHPVDEYSLGFGGWVVRIRDGASVAEFRRAVEALVPDEAVEFKTLDATSAAVRRAVRPQAVALAIFSAVIALAGLVLVVQAIVRRLFGESAETPALHALGITRTGIFAASMLEVGLVAAAGAVLAVILAAVASPLFPVGPARLAEIDPGFALDGPALLGGAFAMLVVLPSLVAWPAWRFASGAVRARAARRSALAGAAAGAGVSPVVVAGMRDALERGRGRNAVPVGTTLGVAIGAMAAVVAALVFAASLDHLVATPRYFGWDWDGLLRVDASGEDPADPEAAARAIAALRDATADGLDDAESVDEWSFLESSRVTLEGPSDTVTVPAVGVERGRGTVTPTIAEGEAPANDGEIALGGRTMDRLGVGIGDELEIWSSEQHESLEVVGRAVFPGLGNYPGADKTTIGDGAVLTADALRALGPQFDFFPIAAVRGDADAFSALTDDLARQGQDAAEPIVGADLASSVFVTVDDVQRPADIRNYDRIRATPVVLAAILALLAAAAVAHALVTTVSARRRDHALLRSLGFTRRQVGGAVATHGSLVAVVSAVVGIPLGIVIGRVAWNALATSIGAVASPAVPALLLAMLVPAMLAFAVVVSLWPARRAMRVRPAVALRSE